LKSNLINHILQKTKGFSKPNNEFENSKEVMMKEGFKFFLKSFFGGCFGCLGAITLLLGLGLLITLIFGPQLITNLEAIVQSVPENLVGKLIGGNGSIDQSFSGEVPQLEVFLTDGDDPSSEHISAFKSADYAEIHFWVRAPEGIAIPFELLLTLPDQSQVQFGPEFQTDLSGKPVHCGQFGESEPMIGDYILEIILAESAPSAGVVEFSITK